MPFLDPDAPQEAEEFPLSVDVESEEEINPADYSDAQEVAEVLAQYWANKPEDELFGILRDKEEECHSAYERRGLFTMNRVAFAQYYGMTGAGGSGPGGMWETQCIQFEGENGELLVCSINELRSYWDQIFNMTTKNRPSFEAQAINTDVDSMAQVEASDNYLQYYYEQNFGERKEKEVVKREGLYGKGWTHIDWDPDGGPDVEIDDEVPSPMGGLPSKTTAKAGELLISCLYPWQVIHEPYRSESDTHLWRMVIFTRSKWEMIARYPLFAKRIEQSNYEGCSREYAFPGSDAARRESDDQITIRIFYHARCAVIPLGKKITFVGSVMVDSADLPVDEIPLVDFMSNELHGTSFGISDLWNMIPLNQLKAQIMSDIATNVEAFGRPPLVLEEGQDLDLDALADGQKVVFVPPNSTRPEPMKFPSVPDASFKALELLRLFDQSISGLNAVYRGEPGNNVSSGAMAALFDNRAVENQSPRQAALDLMRERIGNILLQYLKKFATHPQLVAVAGKDERGMMDSFTKEDIAGVHRVIVKTANPMLRTQAGRMQLAETLRDWPGQPLSDPAQIIQLLTTGQFKPAYNMTRISQLRVDYENEVLLTGPPVQTTEAPDPMTGLPVQKQTVPAVPVLASDNARDHLLGVLEVLNSPAARKNPAIHDAALAHFLEHVEVARNNDPYVCSLLGLPMPQAAMMPPQQPDQGSGPSDKDMSNAAKVSTPPDEVNDHLGARVPKPAKPPAGAQTAVQ